MEDTLRGIQKGQQLSKSMQVLILILMEDTLRDRQHWLDMQSCGVLILILMEDTLRAKTIKRYRELKNVLILILMEDTLREDSNFYNREAG